MRLCGLFGCTKDHRPSEPTDYVGRQAEEVLRGESLNLSPRYSEDMLEELFDVIQRLPKEHEFIVINYYINENYLVTLTEKRVKIVSGSGKKLVAAREFSTADKFRYINFFRATGHD